MEQDLQHIAIILDGNGRWAKAKGMPRKYGHYQGSKNLEKMCEWVYQRGVRFLTVYAFSTENWKRPQAEVDTLMDLFRDYMKTAAKRANKNNMRVLFLGDKQGLPQDLREKALSVEADTAANDGLTFCVAINYGSRDEILRATRALAARAAAGELSVEEIDEAVFADELDTRGIPDPDLLIRTSGEQRLSNYLLWQLAYTEFYFTDVHWPDFREAQLDEAIADFQRRKRKFGTVEEA